MRGTEGEPSGTQDTQPKAATSDEIAPDKPENESQAPSISSNPQTPDSSLQDVQRQLALNLIESKELLKQILHNSERQVTLLKASLGDSWRDPGQAAHLRAALDSEKPWSLSDEALVNIEAGANEQELYKTDTNYPLESLCYDFGDTSIDIIAMLIILAVWGFPDFIHNDLESTGVGPEVLRAAFRASNSEETDVSFFKGLAALNSALRNQNDTDIWLKRGDTFVRMKQRCTGVQSDQLLYKSTTENANELLAKLMMQEWTRSFPGNCRDWSPEYYWGLEPSEIPGKHKYGSWSFVSVSSIGMSDNFMSMANMANVVSRSAVTTPNDLRYDRAELAIAFLLSFTGPWKNIQSEYGLNAVRRSHLSDRQPLLELTEFSLKRQGMFWMETLHLTIRVFSPIEEHIWTRRDEGGIKLSRVLGGVFDSKKRASLMFETSSDSSFQSSDRYFFVTELLRISTEWIKETGSDLKIPQSTTNSATDSAILFLLPLAPRNYDGEHPSAASWKACSDVINHNWTIVFQEYDKYEKDLLDRIERKTQEVKSLRDGLFSATSVREATKGTNINEYILVFTVMTITYLPLGFVATLYGIDMFNFEMPGQTKSFAIATEVVSLATYLAAWGLLYGVRQRRKKGSFGELLSWPRGWVRPTVDATRRVFKVGNDPKQAAKSSRIPEIEVRIDEELPPELPETDNGRGKNPEAPNENQESRWKAIPYWVTRRRRRQEASVGLETA
ncbi:hypothetical protein PG993_012017 [Apiospora rasikravindrae]|uniref:Uncharacterized protein n=1 Tax=Apiospora rasikravindrae TaxID=990691 RepID=A0ABR1S186_9PEZI